MPGGRLPQSATASASARSSSYRSRRAAHSSAVTSGPGSLSWVVSPVARSTTAMVRRVFPATVTRASVTGAGAVAAGAVGAGAVPGSGACGASGLPVPGSVGSCGDRSASSSRSTAPVAPPANPVTTVRWPRAESTRATFSPLPPGRSDISLTRWLACGTSSGTPYVRSSAVFSVTVRITAAAPSIPAPKRETLGGMRFLQLFSRRSCQRGGGRPRAVDQPPSLRYVFDSPSIMGRISRFAAPRSIRPCA